MSHIDVITDLSDKKLKIIPDHVLRRTNTKMLYLERNSLEELPSDFFTLLPRLTWLDLRNNKLKAIPKSIANHQCLETLLLQDNQIQSLPDELGLLPKLKVLQLAGNPLTYPSDEILKKGVKEVCKFLKEKYDRVDEPPPEELPEILPVEEVPSKHSIKSKKKSKTKINKPLGKKMTIQELLQASSRTAVAMGGVWPVISIKSIKCPENETAAKKTVADVFFVPKSSDNKMAAIIKRSSQMSPANDGNVTQRPSSDIPPKLEKLPFRPKSAKPSLKTSTVNPSKPSFKSTAQKSASKSLPRQEFVGLEKETPGNDILIDLENIERIKSKSEERYKSKTSEKDKFENEPQFKATKSEQKGPIRFFSEEATDPECEIKTTEYNESLINNPSQKNTSIRTRRPGSPKSRMSLPPQIKSNVDFPYDDKLITMDEAADNEMTSLWLENLKEVLNQQETILQQERNLKALNSWRLQKKMEPVRSMPCKKLENPYDTDPEYDQIISRKDIGRKTPKKPKKSPKPLGKDLQELLSEVSAKLKEFEKPSISREPKSPRSDQMAAEREIREISELQKKILQARKAH